MTGNKRNNLLLCITVALVYVNVEFLTSPKAIAQQPSLKLAGAQKRQKISIEFKNAPVRDIISAVLDQAGANHVFADSVPVNKTMTIRLKQVDWFDAFVLILQSNQLTYEIVGNAYFISAK